jgi:hypothetical protein
MTTIPVGARSALVTLLGWMFSVLGALGALSVAGWTALRGSPPAIMLAVLICLLVVALGVGLLRRADWARRLFIALLTLGIAGHMLGLWALWPQLPQVIGLSPALAGALGVSGASAVCALMVWAIGRLMSRRVRLEFV